jgi:endonuclease/exonuclease/phosphatase family metal-dependent hydrolase
MQWVFVFLLIVFGFVKADEQGSLEAEVKTLRAEVDTLKATVEKLSSLIVNKQPPLAPNQGRGHTSTPIPTLAEPPEYAGGGGKNFPSRVFSYSSFLENANQYADSVSNSSPDEIISRLTELGYMQNEQKIREFFVPLYGGVICKPFLLNKTTDEANQVSSFALDYILNVLKHKSNENLSQENTPYTFHEHNVKLTLFFGDNAEVLQPIDHMTHDADGIPSMHVIYPSIGYLFILNMTILDSRYVIVVSKGLFDDLSVQSFWLDRSKTVHLLPLDADGTVKRLQTNLSIMSYNVWNSNPPRWLWHDPLERWRMYNLRMAHLGDVLRFSVPAFENGFNKSSIVSLNPVDIFAFQEVRYDTRLGGYDHNRQANSKATFEFSTRIAYTWYNRTSEFAKSERYAPRNQAKWDQVIRESAIFCDYSAGHAFEEGLCAPSVSKDIEPQEEGVNSTSFFITTPISPYLLQQAYRPLMSLSEESQGALIDRIRATPHSQVSHLAAILPGYYHVHSPGQLYLEKNNFVSERHRDEEGPAIFSKFPIVHSDHLLLSRDSGDPGDGHQRIVLHAVIEVPLEGGNGQSILIDVFTSHLPLSEAARNRTVLEIIAFIASASIGDVQVFTGDMNAEPHESALKLFTWDHLSASSPPPAMRYPQKDGAGKFSIVTDERPLIDQLHQVQRETDATYKSASFYSTSPISTIPQLSDAWLASGHAEPAPRDTNQAIRRYGFTFPSDDPVKRIDMIYTSSKGDGAGVAVNTAYLLGQDPLPATEATEGKGLGMVSQNSPIYASDHRALVATLTV